MSAVGRMPVMVLADGNPGGRAGGVLYRMLH
jgi:hypothetical protein